MKRRIYQVKIALPTPTVRLVRAANVATAFRHVAESLIEAKVASQDALVSLVAAGVKVEEIVPTAEAPTQTPTASVEEEPPSVAELPAHMDRRVPREKVA